MAISIHQLQLKGLQSTTSQVLRTLQTRPLTVVKVAATASKISDATGSSFRIPASRRGWTPREDCYPEPSHSSLYSIRTDACYVQGVRLQSRPVRYSVLHSPYRKAAEKKDPGFAPNEPGVALGSLSDGRARRGPRRRDLFVYRSQCQPTSVQRVRWSGQQLAFV